MPIDKVFPSFDAAVADIPNGATVMIGGFAGPGGMPSNLILALRNQGARGLTVISNTAGLPGFAAHKGQTIINQSVLFENKQVKKLIATYPVPRSMSVISAFMKEWQAGEVELEVVPQGTYAERLRAGGAGIAAFYTPTAVGTHLAKGKEVRAFDGRDYLLERALKADYALIHAHKADKMGNLVYKGTSRSFNVHMATAAKVTIAEVDEIVETGDLDPEHIVTPGIYVKRIVARPRQKR